MSKIKNFEGVSKGANIYLIPLDSNRLVEIGTAIHEEILSKRNIVEFHVETTYGEEIAIAYPIKDNEPIGESIIIDMSRMGTYTLLKQDGSLEKLNEPIGRIRGVYSTKESAEQAIDLEARAFVAPDIVLKEVNIAIVIEDELSEYQSEEITQNIKNLSVYGDNITTFNLTIPAIEASLPGVVERKVEDAKKQIVKILQDRHNVYLETFDKLFDHQVVEFLNNESSMDVLSHESLFDEMPDVNRRSIQEEGSIQTYVIELEDSTRSVIGYIQVDEDKDCIVGVSREPFKCTSKIKSDLKEEETEHIVNARKV